MARSVALGHRGLGTLEHRVAPPAAGRHDRVRRPATRPDRILCATCAVGSVLPASGHGLACTASANEARAEGVSASAVALPAAYALTVGYSAETATTSDALARGTPTTNTEPPPMFSSTRTQPSCRFTMSRTTDN